MAKITPETGEEQPKTLLETINSPKATIILFIIIGALIAFVFTNKPEQAPKPIDRTVSKISENTTESTKGLSNTQNTPDSTLSEIEKTPETTSSGTTEKENSPLTTLNEGTNSGTLATSGFEDIESDENTMNNTVSGGAIPHLTPPTSIENSQGTLSQSGGLAEYFGQYSGKGTPYFQSSVGYGFVVPKGTYYQGFGAKDGASHSVAFMTGTGVTDWDSANVKLWFYKKSLPPELQSVAGKYYEDPSSGIVYYKVGSGAIKIQGNSENPIVQSIIESIKSE